MTSGRLQDDITKTWLIIPNSDLYVFEEQELIVLVIQACPYLSTASLISFEPPIKYPRLRLVPAQRPTPRIFSDGYNTKLRFKF